MGPSLKTWHRTALVPGAAILILLAITWVCRRDPSLNFLPGDKRASWILFPTALDATVHNVATTDTIFRRVFTLDRPPQGAQLSFRAAKRLELKINGTRVGFLVTLAASCAEAGRFPEAVKTAEEARAAAEASWDSSGAQKSEKLLGLFRMNQAYREESPQPQRQP